MYSKLVATELDANKFILLPFLLVVLFFYIYLGINEQETSGFMMASLVAFWASLIVAASKAGHEKRDRQYIQLPVSNTEVFLAGWTYVFVLLGILLSSWIAYGVLFGGEALGPLVAEVLKVGLGVAIITVLISIGIDLSAFRPAYIQWLYIAGLILLLALLVHFETSIGFVGRDDAPIEFYPLALIENDGLEILVAAGLFAGLFLADYLVYRFSDNYLG